MTAPKITVATGADRERTIGSLVAAFTADPVLRYLFPDQAAYPRHAAAFFGYLFDKRVRRATIWTIERGASVAIWEPPWPETGAPNGTAANAVPEVGATNSLAERFAAQLPADALARVRAYDQAVHAAMPTTPYWYLGVLGTHPDYAGRRWGRAVMRAGLRRAADDGLPAVLETSNPANVEMYQRAGWEVVRTITEPLPTWIMQQSSGRS